MKNLTVALLLILCFAPQAGAAERISAKPRCFGHYKPIPADCGWDRIMGADGKPVVPRRQNPLAERRLKIAGLLSATETLTVKGCRYHQAGNYRAAAISFQKALSAFDSLRRQSPEDAEARLIDKAEMLEAYAQTLLKTNNRELARVCSANAVFIRSKLPRNPFTVRTYVNGYLSTGDTFGSLKINKP